MPNLDQYDRKWPSQPSVDFKSAPITARLCVLFGGFHLNFGAAFFTLGMVFIWVAGAGANFDFYKFWFNDTATTSSEVYGKFRTDTGENDRDIWGFKYRFIVADGNEFEGVAYSSTKTPKGDVEYLVDMPDINRLVGFRSSPHATWLLVLFSIFPLIGALLMWTGARANWRQLKALKNSKLARGKLISKVPTKEKINEEIVYEYTFEFMDEKDQMYKAVVKTHDGADIEDDTEERIIYNADRPENSVLVDNLPGKPEVSEDGTVGGVKLGEVVMRMILPVGGTVVHALILLSKVVK